MIYGYARVSTRGQEKDGNSLDAQETLLRENGASEIYSDSFTGKKLERPQLTKLLDPGADGRPGKLQPGDTLIITKLDRIARSVAQGNNLINGLITRGVRVNILNIGVLDNTPASKLIRNIFFSFAEFERDMIIERTQEGKSLAKLDPGFREGRPRKYGKKQINHALKLLKTKTYKQVEELTGISKSTLIRAKKKTV